jgi:hypothetical protein
MDGCELSFCFWLVFDFESRFDFTSSFDALCVLGSKLARTLSPGWSAMIATWLPSRVIRALSATLNCCWSPDGTSTVMTNALGSVETMSPETAVRRLTLAGRR